MKVYVIAAVAQNRAIGYQNQLLYWLPNDLKNFKSLTSGHTIIMGRNTFESLPKGALPNRKNVVLTQQNITLEGCEVYHSLEEALSACQNDEKVFIIGGGKVYEQCLGFADELILTEVNDVPEHADTFFPDYQKWKEKSREHHKKDEKHAFDFDFVHYVKA
ncbi:dihydrofolate reductase [Hoylesella nanceiensis]|uniref:dihydrofolate reductase n=1 Tax=Hoylesella nanceiensis TaxID=425941 RepID=UPI0028E88CE7|nr:dihydrofolate reductase [Hoylesella nanceiensis]